MNTFQKIGFLFSLFIISISWAAEKNWARFDKEKIINSTTVALSSNGINIALADKSPGYIYTSSDAGSTWIEQKWSGQRNWSAVTFSWDGKLLIAANQNGFIYTSSDAGSTWIEQKWSGQRNWSALVSNNDGTKLFAAEFNGYIYTSSDKGVTWIEQTSSGQRSWRSIATSTNGSKVVAASQNGYLYTSTNYGITWTERTGWGKRSWYSIASSADGNKLVAVDFSGYIYTSWNSWSSWSARTWIQRSDWASIASSADGNKLVAAVDNGLVYISTNSGSTWTELKSSLSRRWSFLASSSDGSMIVGTVTGWGVYALTTPIILDITSSKGDGKYWLKDTIPVDFIFSEPVNSVGPVIVTLETWKNDRTCTFTLTNSSKGTCDYVVQEGDSISVLTVNSIKWTIKDLQGLNVVSYVPLKNLSDNKKIVIDTKTLVEKPLICQSQDNYRSCPLSKAPENTTQYRENMICEGFISDKQPQGKKISRIEVLNIAVNMLHGPKSSATEYDNTYTDITLQRNSQETVWVIQTGLVNNLIYPNNGAFEPTKQISRIEAYALLMRGVCMQPDDSTDVARAIHQKALQNAITTKQWARFRPYSSITRNEVYIVASQLADWADKNGGCDALQCRK